jgi:tetratricopeptide (TPR) repeat protein
MVLCVALLLPDVAISQTSVVLFPLRNDSQDELVEWVRYSMPDLFYRRLAVFSGLQVLDPIYLSEIDSSAGGMESDSALRVHQLRWHWTVAVGGAYKVRSDSVSIQLRLFRFKDGQPDKKSVSIKGPVSSLGTLYANLLEQLIPQFGRTLSTPEMKTLEERIARDTRSIPAFGTYASGYGREMTGKLPMALSAYARAAELLPRPGIALARMGRIYERAARFDKARECFERALSAADEDPVVVAEAVDFFVDHDRVEKAAERVQQYQQSLEQTSSGLKVLGKSMLLSGQSQRAVAILTRAVAFGPVDLETEYVLGNAYFATGQFAPASDIFNRLVQCRPDYVDYYSALGAAYRNAGRLMESAQILESAEKIASDDADVLLNLANTYFELGWFWKASQLLERARVLDPEMQGIDLNLAVIFWHTGRRTDAQRLVEAAARSPVNRQGALNDLGNIYFLMGDYRAASRIYEKAVKAGGSNESVLYNLGLTYQAMGKSREAAAQFEEVFRMSPTRIEVMEKLQELSEQMGDSAKAELYYARMLDAAPQQSRALAGLTGLLLGQSRGEEAVAYIEAYLERFPSNRSVRLLLADTYRTMGWHDVAIMKYEEYLRDFPRDTSAFLNMARCLHDKVLSKEGNSPDKALVALTKAAAIIPSSPEPDYLIGDILFQAGKNADAAQHLRAALGKSSTRDMRSRIQKLLDQAEGRAR